MGFGFILLEDDSGKIQLEDNSGFIVLEGVIFARVQATQAGFYRGDYKDTGDVFDLYSAQDLSDSTVSQVPVGDPDYPIYGWMKVVPSSTPLFSWALTGSGASSPRNSPRRTVQ